MARHHSRHRAEPHGGARRHVAETGNSGRCCGTVGTRPYATWFEIDWAAQGNRMLACLSSGARLSPCLADLWVQPSGGPDGEPVLRYFDHVLPLWPRGRRGFRSAACLSHSTTGLTSWRDAAAELNWRRFFDIATLIGIRVEDPAVFDATHQVIVGLVAEGLVDGLRVDHPDGLADPRGLPGPARLGDRGRLGSRWRRSSRRTRRCHPTGPAREPPGYDALRVVDGLFLDPAGGDALSARVRRGCAGALTTTTRLCGSRMSPR